MTTLYRNLLDWFWGAEERAADDDRWTGERCWERLGPVKNGGHCAQPLRAYPEWQGSPRGRQFFGTCSGEHRYSIERWVGITYGCNVWTCCVLYLTGMTPHFLLPYGVWTAACWLMPWDIECIAACSYLFGLNGLTVSKTWKDVCLAETRSFLRLHFW